MRKIVGKFVNEINDLLLDRQMRVRLTEAAVDHMIAVGFDPKMGARPLQRKLNDSIKVPISKKILFDNLGPNTVFVVDYADGELKFDVQTVFDVQPQPIVDSNGYIVLDQISS